MPMEGAVSVGKSLPRSSTEFVPSEESQVELPRIQSKLRF